MKGFAYSVILSIVNFLNIMTSSITSEGFKIPCQLNIWTAFLLQEVFSKGIILLSAIATVRVHGENKFEVVTSHRTFVFRADKEGK